MQGQIELAREHMETGISLLEQYGLLYTNDSIPQISNYAALLTEIRNQNVPCPLSRNLHGLSKNTIQTTVWIMLRYRNPWEIYA